MEYLVMECALSYAVVMDQDGRILKVPNLGYTVGQSLKDVVLLPERPVKQQTLHKRIARWGTMAACLCLLLLGSWVWQSPIGTVRMQINPDVQMSVNRFDRVVALEGLNEDGAALIDGYHAYGKGMKAVSDELADRAMEQGYLADGGKITLTVSSEKDGWKTAAEEMLLLELEVHFENCVTVTVDGKQPPAEQEPTEEIVIPSQPEEDSDEDDTDDDPDDSDDDHADDTQEKGAPEVDEDDGVDDDDLDAAVSTSGDPEDEDEQDDTPPGFVSDDDDDDPEQPDDDAADSDSDDDDENGDD